MNHRTNSLDYGSTHIPKLPSEGNINFTSSGAGSLVIHPEVDSDVYVGSQERISEVNEDLIRENPEFYHHLSLRFYGQETDTFIPQNSQSGSCHYSEDNQLDYPQDQMENSEYFHNKKHYQQIRSFTDLHATSKEARRKRSNVEYCCNGDHDYENLKRLREMNRRSANKSEGPAIAGGLLDRLNFGNVGYKKTKNFKGSERLSGSIFRKEFDLMKQKNVDGDENEKGGGEEEDEQKKMSFLFNKEALRQIGTFGINAGRRAKAAKNLA